ncbi:MAG: type II toxin-antitoxin system VapC family toxin [Cyclobacteriaceae bacterium]
MYLIDTHILLWWLTDPSQLSPSAMKIIQDARNEVYVSAASIWEIAIKSRLGKLSVPDDLMEVLEKESIQVLSINEHHAWRTSLLPNHHKDPFDHMIIAQAQQSQMALISRDKKFERYDLPKLIIG